MRIAVGSDHRGFELKQSITKILAEAGYEYKDFGSFSNESVDYPDIAKQVAEAVTKGNFDRGILICDTGIGMSIAANKVHGARAALCNDGFCAYRARLHNDANILTLGTSISESIVRDIIKKFLTTEFEGGRHIPRINKIKAMED